MLDYDTAIATKHHVIELARAVMPPFIHTQGGKWGFSWLLSQVSKGLLFARHTFDFAYSCYEVFPTNNAIYQKIEYTWKKGTIVSRREIGGYTISQVQSRAAL